MPADHQDFLGNLPFMVEHMDYVSAHARLRTGNVQTQLDFCGLETWLKAGGQRCMIGTYSRVLLDIAKLS